MKQSTLHIKTLKESPFEGKMTSQHLMFRAGMMKKNGAGDYSLMPYGIALYEELKKTVDNRFNRIGYQKIGVLEYNKLELLKQLRSDIVSYKDLPLKIQTDSLLRREEHSVKHGLIGSRSMPIKGLQVLMPTQETYEEALKSIWQEFSELHEELGLPFKQSQLFSENKDIIKSATWLESPYGDQIFYNCKSCAYCSDELGAGWQYDKTVQEELSSIEEIITPDVKTIADLEVFLSIKAEDLMKTMLLHCDIKGKALTLAVVIRGDRELNISKVARYMKMTSDAIEMVTDPDAIADAGTIVGFAGPIGLLDVMLLVDEEVTSGRGMVAGANKKDYHLKNVVYGRDFETKHVGSFSTAKDGDACPVCGEPLHEEVGYTISTIEDHQMHLSKSLDIKFKNDAMKEERPFIALGEIDYYKLLIGYLDHHHDENGFILTPMLSPYDVHIVVPNIKKEEQCIVADQIAFELESNGKRVLLDDRKGSAGAKFKDSDLLGIPVRVTAGKFAADGIVELKYRNKDEKIELSIKEVLDKLIE